MKQALAIALICLSGNAISDSNIYDIMYLPKAGTTYGISELSFISGRSEIDDLDGDLSGYNVKQELGHALSDRLSLSLSINFLRFDQNIEDKQNNVDYVSERSGLQEPGITVRYRAIDSDFRLDFFGTAFVSYGDAETETTNKPTQSYTESSSNEGQHSVLVGTQMGQKYGMSQWAFGLAYQRNLGGTIKDNNVDREFDGSQELSTKIEAQRSLDESTMVRAMVGVLFQEKVNFKSGASYRDYTRDMIIGAEFLHTLSDDVMLSAGGELHQLRFGTYDKYNYGIFTLGINYQF